MSRLVGWRTVILNAILVAVGAFRIKNPGSVPDDSTVLALASAILDAIFSLPGAGILNILMRIFVTKTPFRGG
jgi:hypothetical protein